MRKILLLALSFSMCAQLCVAGIDDLKSSQERLVFLLQKKNEVEAKLEEAMHKRDEATSSSSSRSGSPRYWADLDSKALEDFTQNDRLVRGCHTALTILDHQIRNEEKKIAELSGQDCISEIDHGYETCENSEDDES